jgi:ATP-dependent Lon protease
MATKNKQTETDGTPETAPEPSRKLPGGKRVLPLVPLRETVIFPEMIVPLQVGREKSVRALDTSVGGDSSSRW